ncbi:uncharacterized protein [Palaemon carinicauda]|uniref:uncharacterized protein n=1 Tax=Palaemon carinicauda TaxID=392227 RepID=UPI0035B61356
MLKYTGISFLLQAMFISAAAFPQMSDHSVAALNDTHQQTVRKLLINIPCLPCHQADDSGQCRMIYDCLVDVDNETTTAEDTDEIDYGKDDVQNTTDTELSMQPLNKPVHESLCLPCFEVDHFLRCRRVKGCVVSTVTGTPDSNVYSTPFPEESITSEAYSENSTLMTTTSSSTGNTQDQDLKASATVDERTSAPDFSDHESGSPNITTSTDGNTKISSESPIPTTAFITDIPLLKTFSPPAVTQLNVTTEITDDTTQDERSPTDILLKTPTSSVPSLPTSERTSSDGDNGTVVTTQATITTTTDPCLNKNENFGVNIWCYFRNLWKWKR